MIIFPAIDLRGGKVVRLKEGDPQRQKTFSDDPVGAAQRWIDEGASWIHVVNLDGAFGEAGDNLRVIERIAALDARVQMGGGLRDAAGVARVLDMGVSRAVIGTAAVANPAMLGPLVKQYGVQAIGVALDIRGGAVTTHGWQQSTGRTATALAETMRQQGVQWVLFTDVDRDGLLTGSNVDSTIALGRDTGMKVIASGGVSTLDEIEILAESRAVAGAVIGMALYEGRLSLADCIAAARKG
jgi:phosphoribosylformimino-5-aminoimidazole carboxamide ribotide isomerase